MIAASQIYLGRGASAKVPTAADYVQDGLIAMWDGIENAGWGTHDANATTWKDLIGSRNATLINGGFDANSLTHSATTNTPAWFSSAISAADSRTVEIVMLPQPNSSGRGAVICAGGTLMASADKVDGAHDGFYGASIAADYTTLTFGNSYCFGIPAAKAVHVAYNYSDKVAYVNGLQATSLGTTNYNTYSFGSRNRVPSIGGFAPGSTGNNIFTGHIYRIAYYSRALTADEIAANYAIDKERFGLT